MLTPTPGQPGEVLVRGYNVMTRLLGRPGGDRRGDRRRRLAAHRRRRGHGRRRQPADHRPPQGHVRRRRLQRLPRRDRAGPRAARGGVSEAAVIGVPDERMGEVGKAFVVPRPGPLSPPRSSSPGAGSGWPTTRCPRVGRAGGRAAQERDRQGHQERAAQPMTVFEPAQLGPLTLRNRIIKAATFEGRTRRGAVTDELIAFHARSPQVASGMTTVAYCAVSPAGRVFRDCLVLDARTVPGLRRLDRRRPRARARWPRRSSATPARRRPARNRHPVPRPVAAASPAGQGPRPQGDRGRPRRGPRSTSRPRPARGAEAGFDCLEVHLGHNYLLSSFLSARTSTSARTPTAAPLENRAALPAGGRQGRARRGRGPTSRSSRSSTWTTASPRGCTIEDSLRSPHLLQAGRRLDALRAHRRQLAAQRHVLLPGRRPA